MLQDIRKKLLVKLWDEWYSDLERFIFSLEQVLKHAQ